MNSDEIKNRAHSVTVKVMRLTLDATLSTWSDNIDKVESYVNTAIRDAVEAANERADKAEAERDKLRGALESIAAKRPVTTEYGGFQPDNDDIEDCGNTGDIRSHGYCEGLSELSWMAESAIRALTPTKEG
jgi:hypothetical protein